MHNYYFSNEFRAPHKVWKPIIVILNGKHPTFEELNKSQYPDEFRECDQYAHNRMIMGSFRYGLIERQSLLCYEPAKESIKRVNKYLKDGNLEHLIDACNMIKIAYYRGKKFLGQRINSIDDGEHAKPIN